MKISVITPSFNSGDSIDRAIQSVLSQDYTDYEHVIVDGKSTDKTLDILKRYDHLKWISELDNGQVDAMNKGFRMASGDIIVYLNADDLFLEDAFSAVIPHFQAGEKIVMGKVLVKNEQSDGIQEWINDPKADFDSMLRHWEPNAFCVNPVGYFYRREIQDKLPYNENNDDKQDLEFLLEVARRYTIKKIDHLLGVFNNSFGTKTATEQLFPRYWRENNFPFIDSLLDDKPAEYCHKFRIDRERGYQLRRCWTVQESLKMGLAKELFQKREIFLFPEDERDTSPEKGNFVENIKIVTPGDWVIPVLTMGKVASTSIHGALKDLSTEQLPAQLYHVHTLDHKLCHSKLPRNMSHFSVGMALGQAYQEYRNEVKWKFIAGVRDPIACGLSELFHNAPDKACSAQSIENQISGFCNYACSYFDEQYRNSLGIDIYRYEFEKDKGYSCLIVNDNIEVLIYKFELLPGIFRSAMQDYLGIAGVELPYKNVAAKKSYAEAYNKAKEEIRFDMDFLDRIYSSRMVHHFYSANEIDEFSERWVKKPSPMGNRARTNQQPNSYRCTDFKMEPRLSVKQNEYGHVLERERWYGTIYDVGMHVGQDTAFYLKKGFRVVAIEANPLLAKQAEERFAQYIQTGQLIVLNIGIVSDDDNKQSTFYVNENFSEWSSFKKEIALRENHPYHTVTIECSSLASIVKEYGDPYYVKIDIEGHDELALRSLAKAAIIPKFLSVENGVTPLHNILYEMGYRLFKFVQQNDVQNIKLPDIPLEGVHVEHVFEPGSSGLFGEETSGEWKNYENVLKEIEKVWNLESGRKQPTHRDEIHGWFDLHAKLR